jgi:hypothetical protein
MSLQFKITHNFREIEQLTRKYPDASLKAREAKITEAIFLLERNIKVDTPEGAGPIHLRDTIHEEVFTYGKNVIGLVGTPALYGESVEYGTEPHFPPVDAIQHWVEGKLHLSGKEAKSVAWAIAIKIADVGTEGAHMFQYGVENSELQIFRILEQIPGEIIDLVTHGLS